MKLAKKKCRSLIVQVISFSSVILLISNAEARHWFKGTEVEGEAVVERRADKSPSVNAEAAAEKFRNVVIQRVCHNDTDFYNYTYYQLRDLTSSIADDTIDRAARQGKLRSPMPVPLDTKAYKRALNQDIIDDRFERSDKLQSAREYQTLMAKGRKEDDVLDFINDRQKARRYQRGEVAKQLTTLSEFAYDKVLEKVEDVIIDNYRGLARTEMREKVKSLVNRFYNGENVFKGAQELRNQIGWKILGLKAAADVDGPYAKKAKDGWSPLGCVLTEKYQADYKSKKHLGEAASSGGKGTATRRDHDSRAGGRSDATAEPNTSNPGQASLAQPPSLANGSTHQITGPGLRRESTLRGEKATGAETAATGAPSRSQQIPEVDRHYVNAIQSMASLAISESALTRKELDLGVITPTSDLKARAQNVESFLKARGDLSTEIAKLRDEIVKISDSEARDRQVKALDSFDRNNQTALKMLNEEVLSIKAEELKRPQEANEGRSESVDNPGDNGEVQAANPGDWI